MEKLIWQPVFCSGYDFKVCLDEVFAREMIRSQVPIKKLERMNQLANEDLKRWKMNCLDPYSFHGDSCFLRQIYLSEGRWLATDYHSRTNLLKDKILLKPIEYNSHNVDTPRKAFILMALFDKWIKYSDVLKGD